VGSTTLIGEEEGAFKTARLPLSLADIQKMIIKLNNLLEAVALNHMKGPDGKCVDGCWSCKVEDSMRSLAVAKKIGE
jgi:hypothetical protein